MFKNISVRHLFFIPGILLVTLAISCNMNGSNATANDISSSQVEDADQQLILSTRSPTLTASCPSLAGEGTVAPAITIHSITFLIDDEELTLSAGDMLPASFGSEVSVKEIEICVGTFIAGGGEACVDFAPIRKSGKEVRSEHAGTHLVPLTPGLIIVSGLDYTWTINQSWEGIAAVVNHWPGVKTEDLECAQGQCERDHRLVFLFR